MRKTSSASASSFANQGVRSIVAQITGRAAAEDAQFTAIDHTQGHAGVRSLVSDGRLATTLLLWVVFCIAFTILVFIPLWAPTLLVRPDGLQPSQAFAAVALDNGGAVIGMLLCRTLIGRVDPFKLLAGAFLLATMFTAAVGQMPDRPALTIASAFFSGMFLGSGGVGVIALATYSIPRSFVRPDSGGDWRSPGLGRFADLLRRVGCFATAWEQAKFSWSWDCFRSSPLPPSCCSGATKSVWSQTPRSKWPCIEAGMRFACVCRSGQAE